MIQAPETLTTQRLLLRRPAVSDAADVYAYAHDIEVTRYMDWPTHTSPHDSVEFLKTCAPRWESGQEFCWAITVKSDPRMVGAIGCQVRSYDADFGYVLHRDCWRHGYATEAARAVVTWIMQLPEMYRISATCDTENSASSRVLEKAGLVKEGTLRRSVIRPNLSTEPRDTFLFALVRDKT